MGNMQTLRLQLFLLEGQLDHPMDLVRWFVVFFKGQPSVGYVMSRSECFLLGTSPRQPLSSHFIENLKGFIARIFLTTNNIDICVLSVALVSYQASLQSTLVEFLNILQNYLLRPGQSVNILAILHAIFLTCVATSKIVAHGFSGTKTTTITNINWITSCWRKINK